MNVHVLRIDPDTDTHTETIVNTATIIWAVLVSTYSNNAVLDFEDDDGVIWTTPVSQLNGDMRKMIWFQDETKPITKGSLSLTLRAITDTGGTGKLSDLDPMPRNGGITVTVFYE